MNPKIIAEPHDCHTGRETVSLIDVVEIIRASLQEDTANMNYLPLGVLLQRKACHSFPL